MILMVGMSGPAVAQLQRELAQLGEQVADDGIFGAETCRAVESFQIAHSLQADGVAGPLTQAAIAAALLHPGAWTPGLDVSSYQPNTNWSQVVAAGYKFAFVKATEGTYIRDGELIANWSRTKNCGILRGAYHFFRGSQDGAAQAEFYLDRCPAGASDLPPVLDLETQDGAPASKVISGARAWLDVVQKATGKTPLIYTGLGFMNSIGNPDFSAYPLWCAQYGPSHPSPVGHWSSWRFWQWSESERIPGVLGPCDADWFNGSVTDLMAFAQGKSI